MDAVIVREKKIYMQNHEFTVGSDICIELCEYGETKTVIGNIVDMNMVPESCRRRTGDGYFVLDDLEINGKRETGSSVIYFSEIKTVGYVYGN